MQQIEFHLYGEFIELNPLPKPAGVCRSGGAGHVVMLGTERIRVID